MIVSPFTFHGSSPEHLHISIHGHNHGRISLIRLLPFLLPFLLSVPVFLFHLELSTELISTKCMANNLRCSAAEEREDTLNAFTSPTKCQMCYRVLEDKFSGENLACVSLCTRTHRRTHPTDLGNCFFLVTMVSILGFL